MQEIHYTVVGRLMRREENGPQKEVTTLRVGEARSEEGELPESGTQSRSPKRQALRTLTAHVAGIPTSMKKYHVPGVQNTKDAGG